MSVATARRAPAGARLTYRGGADGLGDPDATLTDCPLCGQAVRVELHGQRLSATCYGGCSADRLAETLDAARIAAELGSRS
jgi:hypothetical protein